MIGLMALWVFPAGIGLLAVGLAGSVDRVYGYKTGVGLANWALVGLSAVFFIALSGLWLYRPLVTHLTSASS